MAKLRYHDYFDRKVRKKNQRCGTKNLSILWFSTTWFRTMSNKWSRTHYKEQWISIISTWVKENNETQALRKQQPKVSKIILNRWHEIIDEMWNTLLYRDKKNSCLAKFLDISSTIFSSIWELAWQKYKASTKTCCVREKFIPLELIG